MIMLKKVDFEDKINEMAKNFGKFQQELKSFTKSQLDACERTTNHIKQTCEDAIIVLNVLDSHTDDSVYSY